MVWFNKTAWFFILFNIIALFPLNAREDALFSLTDNWRYLQDKLPEKIEPKALATRLVAAEVIAIPYTVFSFLEEKRMHYFSRTLPPHDCRDCVLFISTLSDPAMIFLNGERILDFGTTRFPEKIEYAGRGPVLVPVENGAADNIVMLAMIDIDGDVISLMGDMFYGERAEIMKKLLLRELDKIILWGLFAGVSIISIMLYIMDQKKINFLILAVDTIAMMCFSISMTDVLAFLSDDVFYLTAIQSYAPTVVVSFYIFFLSATSRIRWIALIGASVILFHLIGFTILQKEVTSSSGMYFDIVAAITMLSSIVSVLIFTKDRAMKKIFIISFLIVIPVTAHDLLIMGAVLPSSRYLIPWGMAATFFPFIYHQIVTFSSIEKTLEDRDNELLQLKMNNLKDKMKPHFVRNTLAIISSYITRDTQKAKESVDHLAACYNFLLHSDKKHIIPLEEEMKFVKDYGKLLMIKFSDVLKINYKLKGDLSGVVIPALTLQPIVENAYNHGIRRIRRGKIDIGVDVKDGHVKISVKNSSNGKSIDDPFSGTLGSIRRRLIYFFEDADISIATENNETTVLVQYGKMKDFTKTFFI